MMPVARVGDKHVCPQCGSNAIVSGGKAMIDGRQVARVGDKTACGASIITGSSMSMQDGKPVAYQGSMTSHGGSITEGSPNHKVMP